MHLIKGENEYLLFDNATISVYRLSKEQGAQLEKYTDDEINDLLSGFNEQSDNSAVTHESLEYKRADRIVLVISQACNMGCKYCYAQEGSYGEEKLSLMSFETLKKTIEKVIEIYPDGVSRIQFFGGEPLINFALMKKAVPWILQYFEDRGLESPSFTIVTNGTLITSEVHDFFNRYGVNVTVSIDGNKVVNDTNRVFKSTGLGTYDCITNNLKLMNKDRRYILMLEMTVDRSNFLQCKENDGRLLDIEDLLEFKPDLFHIVPAIWPKGHSCSFDTAENFALMKEYFINISRFAAKQFGSDRPVNVIKMADMARSIIRKRKRDLLCGAGIDQFSVDVNGDIYPCFAFIGQSDFKMGNVFEKENTLYQKVRKRCSNNTFRSIDECKQCWANGLCSNCIGNSYLVNGQIDKPIKELCTVQKATLEQAILSCYKMVNR